jgi:hypothetical protein
MRDVVFTEERAEIERLHDEDPALFEEGGESRGAHSGEEYRQELRRGLDDPDTAGRLKALPWGSGSGLVRPGADHGFVFCVRVGDHPDPLYRYVGMVDPAHPEIVADTLTCLAHADADDSTVRVLPEDTHRLAYDAWAAARTHILEEWTESTDPAHLHFKVPKTMRDAYEIVKDHPPVGMEQSEVRRLQSVLQAPWGNRIQRMIRDAMADAPDPQAASDAIRRIVAEQGLQPASAPRPLPVITADDIHLVCWQAIVPEDDVA